MILSSTEIFNEIKEQNFRLIHDYLQSANPLLQYMIVKSVKLANYDLFRNWAVSTRETSYSLGSICAEVLKNFYNVPPHLLECSHKEENGIKGLSDYLKVAKNILNN